MFRSAKDRIDFDYMLTRAADAVHENARTKGFWDGERNDGEMIALMHSELSEALEEVRIDGHPRASEKVPQITAIAEEMADLVIRVLDFCHARGIDLGEAIRLKHAYNTTRPHKHGKKF